MNGATQVSDQFCEPGMWYVRGIDKVRTFLAPRINRLFAYRMVARWIWGHRGRDKRVVLPACVVVRIRKEFPSDHVGFKYPAL